MFLKLGKFVIKYRLPIVIFWLAASLTLYFAAPKFADVAVTDESQFLPQDTESSAAATLLEEKFVSSVSTYKSSGTIVLYNADGLTAEDEQEAKNIRDWLISDAAPDVVQGVTSIFDANLLRQSLVSKDQTTMMMQVKFSVDPMNDEAKIAVNEIREYLRTSHPGVQTYFTGQTGLLQDLFESVQQTINKATIVTLVLVLIILLIIYRSPVAALLPLVAIGCSFLATMGVLGILGHAGVKFFTLAEAYLVVIIFGVGTDYCLFIVSRFREELKNSDPKAALAFSIRHIGPVIAASALTVMVAFLCLSLSRFGMNQTAGYALALGIGITLLAGMTLIPALMSLFGKYLFWPKWTSPPRKEGRFSWAKVGNWVVQHPLLVSLPIAVLLLVPYIAFSDFSQTDDIISQMPGTTESVKGYRLIEEHFPAGELYPVYVLIESPERTVTNPASLQSINSIALSLQNVSGVSRVDYYAAPDSQLSALAIKMRGIGDKLGSGIGMESLSSLQTVGSGLESMILQYPGIMQSQNFQQIMVDLTTAGTLANQISATDPAGLQVLIVQIQNTVYDVAEKLDGLVDEFNLAVDTPFTGSLLNTYFSIDKTLARVNVILATGPYQPETADTIAALKKATRKNIDLSELKGSNYLVGGDSAVRVDIMATNNADFGVVVGSAIAGILIVIIILLRCIVAPLYMILTVLLNYGATLGITTWFFSNVLNQSGMIYMLPIFIFIILVALGADYNIFLVSRIREETNGRPAKEAISHAIANTGGVITSCGIIVAGTFATLIVSPLQMVTQLGTAIAIGVLVDTFIVRALLVPAIATLVGRWNWWPSRFGAKSKKETK
jgi:putative drug exporter of the RND superfamily